MCVEEANRVQSLQRKDNMQNASPSTEKHNTNLWWSHPLYLFWTSHIFLHFGCLFIGSDLLFRCL